MATPSVSGSGHFIFRNVLGECRIAALFKTYAVFWALSRRVFFEAPQV
jgi:hypothetical protein